MPPTFPLELADRLRENGIELASTASSSTCGGAARTRPRSPGSGARSARARPRSTSRARCCASATVNGTLVLDGDAAHVGADQGRGRARLQRARRRTPTSSSSRTARRRRSATRCGHGAILPGEPITFDLFPRDRATGVYTDMTRTYVVGEVSGRAARVPPALQGGARPRRRCGRSPASTGARSSRSRATLFAEHGYPTQLTKQPGEVLDERLLPQPRPRRRARGARAAVARPRRRRSRRRRRDRARARALPRRASAASASRTSRSSRRTASTS